MVWPILIQCGAVSARMKITHAVIVSLMAHQEFLLEDSHKNEAQNNYPLHDINIFCLELNIEASQVFNWFYISTSIYSATTSLVHGHGNKSLTVACPCFYSICLAVKVLSFICLLRCTKMSLNLEQWPIIK